MLKRSFVCLLTVAAISLFSRDAAASEFSFGCISNNSATNCSVLESQLSVTITLNATDSSLVDFLFKNSGPAASSITDIYFDDPAHCSVRRGTFRELRCQLCCRMLAREPPRRESLWIYDRVPAPTRIRRCSRTA